MDPEQPMGIGQLCTRASGQRDCPNGAHLAAGFAVVGEWPGCPLVGLMGLILRDKIQILRDLNLNLHGLPGMALGFPGAGDSVAGGDVQRNAQMGVFLVLRGLGLGTSHWPSLP